MLKPLQQRNTLFSSEIVMSHYTVLTGFGSMQISSCTQRPVQLQSLQVPQLLQLSQRQCFGERTPQRAHCHGCRGRVHVQAYVTLTQDLASRSDKVEAYL